ncbi:TIGR01906 family membrane protein [Mahella australiensis]|uniref:Integral membrane protein TIGR01906 n=1 Tax=Mahella australiensis (strain DSM 15567 / CIP 107919 / 50-1 BON) TaxID=697281 RepID=F3ZYI5_MAHA5|nr:TIGR01906 family membrane protein [Mahella australiensis]AEE96727.1 integral membrane protein TIGR01906 [Mahella australiensis 50-1 BON]
MNKAISVVFTIILAVALPIAIVLTSVQLVAFNQGFFMKEFEKYDRAEATGMDRDQLSKVAQAFIDYLSLQKDELNMQVVVNGRQRLLFNDKELMHMDDVRGLFESGFALRLWAAILSIVSIAVVGLWGHTKGIDGIARALAWAAGIPLALGAIVALLLATDFDRWFVYFHLTFFNNDLWQLDPSTDTLINIFNEGFFADAAFRILLYAATAMVVIFAASMAWIAYSNKKAPKNQQ